MAKKGKLLAALDAHRGRDYKLERQKKLAKKATKRKAQTAVVQETEDEGDAESPNGTESKAAAQGDGDSAGAGLDEAPMIVCLPYEYLTTGS